MDQTPEGKGHGEFGEYLSKLRAKDSRTWNEFDFVIRRILLKWICGKRLTSQQAEEVYHETMTVFLEKFAGIEFDSLSGIKSYLFSIAEKKLKEFWRRNEKMKKEVNIECISGIGYIDYLIFSEKEDYRDEINLIGRLMKKLSLQEQQTLRLCFHQELPLDEVARQLQTSNGNVRIIKFRAIRKIREMFNKQLNRHGKE